MADPEQLAVDPDGTHWWEAMVARTLGTFEAADRSRLNELLKPLVKREFDTQVTELGRLGTTER
ncbi:MAG: hypothetical protein ACLP9C_14205 [Acidimicrobiales bacterium]